MESIVVAHDAWFSASPTCQPQSVIIVYRCVWGFNKETSTKNILQQWNHIDLFGYLNQP